MYVPHPSQELNDLFVSKPYQGVAPEAARFLFIGLDANYDRAIETRGIFFRVREYHQDGVAFWQASGVHHPFLLPEYSGDGQFYHRSFAHIGFGPQHAPLVSFTELLHVPTVGRSSLIPADLDPAHLKNLNTAIREGQARHIFIPAGVARLMNATEAFPWLAKTLKERFGPLGIYLRDSDTTVYSHLHFSVYGKFEKQKVEEAKAIRELLELADG